MSELASKAEAAATIHRGKPMVDLYAMHPMGHVEITKALTPAEARELAVQLTAAADLSERIYQS